MKTLIWIVFAGGIQRPLVASAWHNHCIGFWKEFLFFRVKNIPDPLHNEDGKLLMFSGRLPLKPKPQKWTWMKVNIMNNDRLRARDSMVEEVDRCTYLGTQVTKDMEQHWTSRRGQRLRMQASTGATRSGVQKYQHKDKGNASQEASAFTERFSTALKHTKW